MNIESILVGKNRDYLYGISIVAVILHHYGLFLSNYGIFSSPLLMFFDNGNLGVDVFLFCSGYGLCMSFDRLKASYDKPLLSFYKRRLSRIFPQYAIVVCVIILLFYNNLTKLGGGNYTP